MLRYLFQTNYACTLSCIFLLIFILTDRYYERKVRQLFFIAMTAVLILTIADSVDYYIASQSKPSIVRNITSAIGYTLRPVTIYCTAYVLRRREKRKYIAISIPLIANGVIAITSIWTGWMFSFDDSNVFIRGPLGALPFISSGFYMILMLIWTVRLFRKNGQGEMLVVFFVALISTFATCLETVFHYKFILNASIAISLTAYYLYLQVQIYKRDTLTNLLNRHNFYIDAKEHENSFMVVGSIDINNLKKINDENGHEAGDIAILTVVETLEKSLKPGCNLYRVGGDEFMLLTRKYSMQEIEKMLKKGAAHLETTPYSVAIGLALYEPGDDFQTICSKADEIMYEHKRESKLGREEW